MSKLDSIESLINPSTGDDESVAGIFASKQQEIKSKEEERKTQRDAYSLGMDYVSLIKFPVSPEALVLIPEKRAREIKTVCFFYDGRNIRLGCLHPTQEVIEEMENLKEQYYCEAKLYLITF